MFIKVHSDNNEIFNYMQLKSCKLPSTAYPIAMSSKSTSSAFAIAFRSFRECARLPRSIWDMAASFFGNIEDSLACCGSVAKV